MRHATAAVNGGVNETYSLRFRHAHARRRATRYADCARGRGRAADLVVGTDLGRGGSISKSRSRPRWRKTRALWLLPARSPIGRAATRLRSASAARRSAAVTKRGWRAHATFSPRL